VEHTEETCERKEKMARKNAKNGGNNTVVDIILMRKKKKILKMRGIK